MDRIQLLALLSMLLFFGACKDKKTGSAEVKYGSTGVIYGLNLDDCGCCGHWELEIDQSGTRVQFEELPANAAIDLENAVFPFDVKLNWREDENSHCSHIIIEDIKLD